MQKKLAKGYGGAALYKFSCDNTDVIVKKFHDKKDMERGIRAGIEELLDSLIALETNPVPQELKMVRIYDAVLCPNNYLSIIMECAKGQDIPDSLQKSPEDVLKACARYFATFHIQNHQVRMKILRQPGAYIDYAANFRHTLLENLLEDNQGPIPLFSLWAGKEISNLQELTSTNIIRLLPIREQKKFVQLVRATCTHFEKNASTIFRFLNSSGEEQEKPYFLTITHGDGLF